MLPLFKHMKYSEISCHTCSLVFFTFNLLLSKDMSRNLHSSYLLVHIPDEYPRISLGLHSAAEPKLDIQRKKTKTEH